MVSIFVSFFICLDHSWVVSDLLLLSTYFIPPKKRVWISNSLNSIQFHLNVLWVGGNVEIRCVESTIFGVFQKPFLIFMLDSAYKVENVILIFFLLCFSSAVNTLEFGMGSAGPWHVWEFLVFILSLRFTARIWIAMWRSHPLNLGSMESLDFSKLHICDLLFIRLPWNPHTNLFCMVSGNVTRWCWVHFFSEK